MTDAFLQALGLRPSPEPSESAVAPPVPPEGGFRQTPPTPKDPSQDHSSALGAIVGSREELKNQTTKAGRKQ